MTIRQTTLAAAFALAAIGPAHAEGLKPLQGQVIDLGDVSGVAYYTVERDGFRVVATLAKKDEDAVPRAGRGRARPRTTERGVTFSVTKVVSVSISRPEKGAIICSMPETTRSRRRPA